jgi:hypothetical protein
MSAAALPAVMMVVVVHGGGFRLVGQAGQV